MVSSGSYLESFDDLQIWNCFKIGMLWVVEFFLGHHDTLFEEVLIYGNSILLWNEHAVTDSKVQS